MVSEIQHWINGGEQRASSPRTKSVFNSATGEEIARVAMADESDVNSAVSAAVQASRDWRETSLAERTRILYRFRQVLINNTEKLAEILTREHGKELDDARGEVARGVESIEYAAGVPQLIKGEYSEQVSSGVDVYSIRQPLGVIAAISPFNFPVMVPLWICANAIACGNAVVVKPSEQDPSATVELARLWQEAGLPDGVFNVLQGDKDAVDALLAHEDIEAASFVGSTPIARAVYERGTAHGKRVQALGGAKNHMVVMPDADIELAAQSAVTASCGAAGERCMAVSVLVAVGDVADSLVDAVRQKMQSLTVDDGSKPGTDVGPLISATHRDRVSSYVEEGQKEGATLVLDGRTGDYPEGGYFFGPTLFDNVTPNMSIYTDEIFGPVLAVVRCNTYEEAVDLVNGHPLGNGAAIFTRDGASARKFQHDANIGMIGTNVSIPVPVSYYSFGGWKSSLFGDLHMYGPEGIQFFTRGKVVTSRWPD